MPLCRPLTDTDHSDALELYRVLAGRHPVDPDPASFTALLAHPGTTIWGSEADGRITAMATLHLLPNITWGGRPYGLIENVVSLPERRGQGHGQAVMRAVIAAGWQADAYKLMLMTGREAGATGFYRKLGLSADEKHAMTLRRVPVRQA